MHWLSEASVLNRGSRSRGFTLSSCWAWANFAALSEPLRAILPSLPCSRVEPPSKNKAQATSTAHSECVNIFFWRFYPGAVVEGIKQDVQDGFAQRSGDKQYGVQIAYYILLELRRSPLSIYIWRIHRAVKWGGERTAVNEISDCESGFFRGESRGEVQAKKPEWLQIARCSAAMLTCRCARWELVYLRTFSKNVSVALVRSANGRYCMRAHREPINRIKLCYQALSPRLS